jgi:hypothetical protein
MDDAGRTGNSASDPLMHHLKEVNSAMALDVKLGYLFVHAKWE